MTRKKRTNTKQDQSTDQETHPKSCLEEQKLEHSNVLNTSSKEFSQNNTEEKSQEIETTRLKKTHRGRRKNNNNGSLTKEHEDDNTTNNSHDSYINQLIIPREKNSKEALDNVNKTNGNINGSKSAGTNNETHINKILQSSKQIINHSTNEKSYKNNSRRRKTMSADNKTEIQHPEKLPDQTDVQLEKLSEKMSKMHPDGNTVIRNNSKSANGYKTVIQNAPVKESMDFLFDEEDTDDEDDDCIEYKFKPRSVYLANACNLCKTLESNSVKLVPCMQCKMVSYCCEDHCKEDVLHCQLCSIVCDIRDNREQEHIYQNAKQIDMDEFRALRIHIMMICQNASGRQLEANEREILLFPRLCDAGQCREWRSEKLMNCPECKQVSYCISHPEHLSADHVKWCSSFKLFHRIVERTHKQGRIEPDLPLKIFSKKCVLPEKINDLLADLYATDNDVIKDECNLAVISLMATAPLSILYAMQKINFAASSDTLNVHVVGAELQFEADTLNKWESFFLHLMPEIRTLKIVFVGPELNVENVPVDLLGKIRMCSSCASSKRIINFEFQCRKLYHLYAKTPAYSLPDIVCAFNPGLHRKTGYAGLDTWPDTIATILSSNAPFISTAYTEHEAPLDLERIKESLNRDVQVLISPQKNPYASLKPDRNFISEESAPLIFKNFYITVVK